MATNSFTTFNTAFGTCGIAWGAGGIYSLRLPAADDETLAQALRAARDGAEQTDRTPRSVGRAVRRIQRHLDGRPDPFSDVELDLSRLTPFRRKASIAARKVGPGQTTTYGELARLSGSPGGSRAAGSAMANNPMSLLVPCHRVLAREGGLGGFSSLGGVATKLRLLTVEGADLEAVARGGVARLRREDPRLAQVIKQAPSYLLSNMQSQDPFTLLCRSIVHQQVSVKAGATIFRRLLKVGGRGQRMVVKRVLAASEEELRGVGVSRQKASYIRDLAAKTASGALPRHSRLARMDDGAVLDAMVQVKGIGVWTAQMFLMFHLGRLDILPVDDLGLKKGAQQLYGLDHQPGAGELRTMAQPWRPFRSIATWYLWRSLEAGGI